MARKQKTTSSYRKDIEHMNAWRPHTLQLDVFLDRPRFGIHRCELVGTILPSVVMQAIDSVFNRFIAHVCSIDLCGTCCTWDYHAHVK